MYIETAIILSAVLSLSVTIRKAYISTYTLLSTECDFPNMELADGDRIPKTSASI